jgi:hypothetical protein
MKGRRLLAALLLLCLLCSTARQAGADEEGEDEDEDHPLNFFGRKQPKDREDPEGFVSEDGVEEDEEEERPKETIAQVGKNDAGDGVAGAAPPCPAALACAFAL